MSDPAPQASAPSGSPAPGRSAAPLIRVENVWKSFDAGRIPVLRDVNLTVRPGEMIALWGVSGSGKSTLLHLLGGLDVPDRGRIEVDGLSPDREADRLRLRREKVGYVFQMHNLIPDLSLEENVAVPGIAAGWSRARLRQRARALAEKMGLEHRLRHRIQDLSGGERQRTAICRALFLHPPILLADEPTGSLDEKTGQTVFQALRDLSREEGRTVVLATHERRFAESCDRLLAFRDGHVHPVLA